MCLSDYKMSDCIDDGLAANVHRNTETIGTYNPASILTIASVSL
jgi:hypothetical protein